MTSVGSSPLRWRFNGAASRRKRKQQPRKASPEWPSRFNGAASRRKRKPETTRPRPSVRSRFNGAASRRKRKHGVAAEKNLEAMLQWGRFPEEAETTIGPAVFLCHRMLQWGRFPEEAETLAGRPRAHPGGVASMGPLPGGSGNSIPPLRHRCPDPWLQWGRFPEEAETGPTWTATSGRGTGLQWGRFPEEAETDVNEIEAKYTNTLQWGRFPEEAETSTHQKNAREAGEASMGPLPGGSGNEAKPPNRPKMNRPLQWGRFPEEAETEILTGAKAKRELPLQWGRFPEEAETGWRKS